MYTQTFTYYKLLRYTDCKIHRDLKISLYVEMIQLFDKGQMWEQALEHCRELAVQVCVWERESVCVCLCVFVCERERLLPSSYKKSMNFNHIRHFFVTYFLISEEKNMSNVCDWYAFLDIENMRHFIFYFLSSTRRSWWTSTRWPSCGPRRRPSTRTSWPGWGQNQVICPSSIDFILMSKFYFQVNDVFCYIYSQSM